MTTSATNDTYDDETPCDDSASRRPMLVAGGSAVFLGYFAGHVSFASDVREVVRRIEKSLGPIELSFRTL